MTRVWPPLGTEIGSSYRLVSPLGEGSMGAVFLASRGGDSRFAVKLLVLDGSDPRLVARFLREAHVATNLKSEHVVPVVESGLDEPTGLGFLVMPAIDGEDLKQVIARLGPLPPRTAVRIALEAARGLCAAHDAGVIHRDVKPANLLLSTSGARVVTLVADFGIAKQVTSVDSLTATGDAMGSPIYMAPEQFRDAKAVDARADVWSLAMTLYEALAGRSPFEEVRSIADVCIRISLGEFPPVQEAAPWVPRDVAAIVHAALRPDLEQRCPSMQAFGDALLGWLRSDEPLAPSDLRAVTEAERTVVSLRADTTRAWKEEVAPSLAATIDQHDPLLGETLGGSYRLLRKIGQGGMGTVYEAVRPDGRRVAVKVVRDASELGDTLRRFVREGKATSAIDSEHVVRVLDADEGSNVPYLAMELLVGLDLATFVERTGALEPRAVARVFVEAAAGLSAAHARGIVHRDVKPANLFLHERDDETIVTKVCDFGVAKSVVTSETDATTLELTRTGGMLGSPMYMSPEQARNAKHVDERSDVWSLSLSLYEALTGKKPWAECTTMGELIISICTTDITPVQALAPWVEPELAAVVHKGLRRDPGERWATMAELGAALEPLALAGPIRRRDLSALTADGRARVAPRLEPAFASSLTHSPSASSVSSRPQARGKTPVLIALGAACAVVATLAWTQRRGDAPAPAGPSAPVARAVSVRRAVTVKIEPPDAQVTVAGAPRTLPSDGALTLEGEVGEGFDVAISKNGDELRARVLVGRDGTAEPPALRLSPRAPSPAVDPAGSASARARPSAARPVAPPPKASVPAAPPPAPPPTAPKLHGDL